MPIFITVLEATVLIYFEKSEPNVLNTIDVLFVTYEYTSFYILLWHVILYVTCLLSFTKKILL
jgi:hypothetical protein